VLSMLRKRTRKRVLIAGLIGSVVGVEAVVVAAFYWSERSGLRETEFGISPVEPVSNYWYPYPADLVVRPPVVNADAARLDDAEEVIGVEVAGKARAYRLKAMRNRDLHVINDLIGEVPVTVAYCDLSDCVRGYTDAKGKEPLDIAVAGLNNSEMVVKSGGVLYVHKTGRALKPGASPTSIPHKTLVPQRMTWKEWTRLHPRSDVYEGESPR
jgi:Protein of unknown function (DUF3179)